MALIEIQDLWRTAGGSVILRDVNLQIETGETVALIGPTGSGKTTLLRVINLLDPPNRGRVLLGGVDLGSVPEKERVRLRRRMSMVFQKPVMFNATVADNVAAGLRFRGMRGSRAKEEASRALMSVHLSGYEERRATTLSGGEMQRVAMARALVTRPEVLLLDEPTANLDPGTASVVEGLISCLSRDGATVVMATHDISQALRLADRLVYVRHGEIIQDGRPEELIFSPASEEVSSFLVGGTGLPVEINQPSQVPREQPLCRGRYRK